ncbi:MAG: hypothetical protein EBS06_04665 [Proteobacteria bacterium]|nr:hypothetical protein [Pseudomonadota bacterium]
MNIKNEIWILADNRIGTFSQSIGLAEELAMDYKVVTLSYNFLSALPNFILSNSLLRITPDLRKKIDDFGYLPKIIISSGRRSAPIAIALKNKSKGQTKIFQIMNPNLDFKKFDLVILPKHDEVDETKNSNLITTIGSLTRIDEKRLASEREKFPELKKITKTKIALLVGGSSKKTKFTKSDAENLAKISSRAAKNINATLLVLTSRRTGFELIKTIKENLDCDFQLFDWNNLNGANPYLAIVALADFFIVSGDSVSMISECASTGKPVYIFDQAKISSDKHRKFHHNLVTENYARKLVNNLENFLPKKLQETKRVALLIKNKIT